MEAAAAGEGGGEAVRAAGCDWTIGLCKVIKLPNPELCSEIDWALKQCKSMKPLTLNPKLPNPELCSEIDWALKRCKVMKP